MKLLSIINLNKNKQSQFRNLFYFLNPIFYVYLKLSLEIWKDCVNKCLSYKIKRTFGIYKH